MGVINSTNDIGTTLAEIQFRVFSILNQTELEGLISLNGTNITSNVDPINIDVLPLFAVLRRYANNTFNGEIQSKPTIRTSLLIFNSSDVI